LTFSIHDLSQSIGSHVITKVKAMLAVCFTGRTQ